ncbi:hypothetical protein [Novosphingobium ginsenosidimutans]|uniref:hypothetical protein n=1 Tax=Novosphingobium ginsenosidimutans TaxID=1176536 RepID=UPI0013756465|nr:hypothetical protein [Novosphingobium ginsenosidimutans]
MPADSSLKSQAGADDSTATISELRDQLSKALLLLDKLKKPLAAAYVQMALDTLTEAD